MNYMNLMTGGRVHTLNLDQIEQMLIQDDGQTLLTFVSGRTLRLDTDARRDVMALLRCFDDLDPAAYNARQLEAADAAVESMMLQLADRLAKLRADESRRVWDAR